MRPRAFGIAVVLILLVPALALAAHCIICHKQIPEGEKYCAYHKGMIAAQHKTALKEKEYVDAVIERRKAYREALSKLRQLYLNIGNAERVEWASSELKDLDAGRHYRFMSPVDTLSPDMSPTKVIQVAEDLYKKAEALRAQMLPPWGKEARLKEARNLYLKLIRKYPESRRLSDAAFALGDIMGGMYFREYESAAKYYKLSFQWNPKTRLPARYQAGLIYENKLGEYEEAARMYYLASRQGPDDLLRQQAGIRLERLQRGGFGKELLNPRGGPAGAGEAPKKKPAGGEGKTKATVE